jgi:hypothetical protein
MSTKQQKLEQVLSLLLSEDQDKAAELLHQIIVEKARVIYESIVEEEDDEAEVDDEQLDEGDEVGGEPNVDFTDEISSDEDEIGTDEENDGEASDEEEEDEGEDDAEEGDVEDRVEDLESQLADLRAEFDALMGEEMMEPQHADLGAEMDDMDDMDAGDDDMVDMTGDDKVVGEVVATMFEKKAKAKLAVAPQAKKKVKGSRADEETQFLSKTGDTGQKGTAKLVGTGKNSPLGAEQTQSPYTHAPSRKDYGGSAKNILGSKATGGEYGAYHGDAAKNDTPSDNVKVEPKKSGIKADTTAKFTGGKSAGEGFTKSPLTKKPA